MAFVFSEREHTTKRHIVLFSGVQSDASSCEQIIALFFSTTIILLISVGIYVVLMTPRTSFFITVAISYIGVCIYERTVVVYICRCVGTSMRISASLNTTIIARFKVLLQYNVNDTS